MHSTPKWRTRHGPSTGHQPSCSATWLAKAMPPWAGRFWLGVMATSITALFWHYRTETRIDARTLSNRARPFSAAPGRAGKSRCSGALFEHSTSRAVSECGGVDGSGAQRWASTRPAVGGAGEWMFGGLSRDDRRCAWRRCAGEPLAQFRVDTRVIQKVEVVRPCQQEPLLARKGQRSILTRAGRTIGAD